MRPQHDQMAPKIYALIGCNLDDSIEGLEEALQQRFSDCEVQRIGQLALFKALMPG